MELAVLVEEVVVFQEVRANPFLLASSILVALVGCHTFDQVRPQHLQAK